MSDIIWLQPCSVYVCLPQDFTGNYTILPMNASQTGESESEMHSFRTLFSMLELRVESNDWIQFAGEVSIAKCGSCPDNVTRSRRASMPARKTDASVEVAKMPNFYELCDDCKECKECKLTRSCPLIPQSPSALTRRGLVLFANDFSVTLVVEPAETRFE
ncbi:hypothetical protein K435DRAFT_797456 [Dendrothele bispora CBS 962.96]|uniref:Uncharacterized protein n=1 Tax=Dendrothele bispora (strain CBS 962.96) TaxID=1314807 RepID=A0A4S8M3M7_DENBC|nr:hypothetical protein K435DRAFT_797456 [Dendrothele bispora CBS 962.96]